MHNSDRDSCRNGSVLVWLYIVSKSPTTLQANTETILILGGQVSQDLDNHYNIEWEVRYSKIN